MNSLTKSLVKLSELLLMNGNTKEYQMKVQTLTDEERQALRKTKAIMAQKHHATRKSNGIQIRKRNKQTSEVIESQDISALIQNNDIPVVDDYMSNVTSTGGQDDDNSEDLFIPVISSSVVEYDAEVAGITSDSSQINEDTHISEITSNPDEDNVTPITKKLNFEDVCNNTSGNAYNLSRKNGKHTDATTITLHEIACNDKTPHSCDTQTSNDPSNENTTNNTSGSASTLLGRVEIHPDATSITDNIYTENPHAEPAPTSSNTSKDLLSIHNQMDSLINDLNQKRDTLTPHFDIADDEVVEILDDSPIYDISEAFPFLRGKIDDNSYQKLNKLSDMLLDAKQQMDDYPLDEQKARYYDLLLSKHVEAVEDAYKHFIKYIKQNEKSDDNNEGHETFNRLISYKRRRLLRYQ